MSSYTWGRKGAGMADGGQSKSGGKDGNGQRRPRKEENFRRLRLTSETKGVGGGGGFWFGVLGGGWGGGVMVRVGGCGGLRVVGLCVVVGGGVGGGGWLFGCGGGWGFV